MNIRILGIDPGSRVTGFAILEKRDRKFHALCCDVIRLTDNEDSFDRLRALYSQISSIIIDFQPDYCAIETPVYGKDPLAMLKLGRAQAAVIMSVLHHNLPLFEYYPKAVKKSVTGRGNAQKEQVAYMLHKLIHIPQSTLSNDATDALAVAWCHFQKMNDPATDSTSTGSGQGRRNKNTWSAFVENHPDRLRKP